MKLGYNIRKIREIRNIKQEYIAEQLGLSLTSYGKLERDEVELSIKRAYEIAKIFSIPLATLIGFDDDLCLEKLTETTHQSATTLLIQHLQETIRVINEEKFVLLNIIEKMSISYSAKA